MPTTYFHPTPEQELLLQAALLPGPAALDAWHRWLETTDFDRLGEAEQRLLPLLYRNLRSLGVAEAALGRYKGFHRRAWYLNQVFLHSMEGVLTALHDAGIPTLLLKGAALVLACYRDAGLRSMRDFDILVPEEQARPALEVLEQQGFRPQYATAWQHAQDMVDSAGRNVDLHWHAVHHCCQAGADADFWAGAIPVRLGQVPTRVLNPADQLLQVCEHATIPDDVPSYRWVADALTIVGQAGTDLDWDRLLEQIEKRRLFALLRSTLGYLHERMGVGLPLRVLAALNLGAAAHRDLLRPRADGSHWRLWFDVSESTVLELVFQQRGVGKALPGLATATSTCPEGPTNRYLSVTG